MATMKDIIQSPLLALFGSMALGLFASSASGSKVVKGGIKGVLPVLVIMTVLSLAARLAGYGSVLGGLVGIFIIVMLPIGIQSCAEAPKGMEALDNLLPYRSKVRNFLPKAEIIKGEA